jgi:glycine cleavage system H protein
MLDVPGCTTKVASDRLYSIEHIWVKQGEGNQVTFGVTDKLQALMATIISISLMPNGTSFSQGDVFGYIEAYKMNVDLICPVSGTIVDSNPVLAKVSDNEMGPVNLDPYGAGWLANFSLTKPDELSGLLTPQDYVALTAKEEEA